YRSRIGVLPDLLVYEIDTVDGRFKRQHGIPFLLWYNAGFGLARKKYHSYLLHNIFNYAILFMVIGFQTKRTFKIKGLFSDNYIENSLVRIELPFKHEAKETA
ncbi:MAG: hypothetical protein LBH43_10750, partial [Treponema sp.]|nr:hypothetical protein [Treponema sp.]